jgi:hypothetical protein
MARKQQHASLPKVVKYYQLIGTCRRTHWVAIKIEYQRQQILLER